MHPSPAFTLAIGCLLAALSLGVGATDPNGYERNVLLVNSTDGAIIEIRARSDRAKPEMVVSQTRIPSNRALPTRIDNGSGACRYDLRFTLEDGRERISQGVDVCNEHQHYIVMETTPAQSWTNVRTRELELETANEAMR